MAGLQPIVLHPATAPASASASAFPYRDIVICDNNDLNDNSSAESVDLNPSVKSESPQISQESLLRKGGERLKEEYLADLQESSEATSPITSVSMMVYADSDQLNLLKAKLMTNRIVNFANSTMNNVAFKDVENFDVTDIVHTHGDYQLSLFQILATVGLEV